MDNRPWTNKYAVTSFDDICGHQELVQLLKENLAEPHERLGHIILYGQSGTGKTSLMNCIIEHVFGTKNFGVDQTKNNRFVLRSNASDERCFDDVEKILLKFAMCHNEECEKRKLKRIVALDEVDSMTPEAQSALQCLLTQFEDRICFIMTCNDISNNVIKPLQSKCMALHVSQVCANDMALMALRVAQHEKLICTETGIDALLLAANGDVRKMLNDFQSVAAANDGLVTEESVLAVSHAPPRIALLQVLKECMEGKFVSALKLSRHLVETVGYDISDILTTMYSIVINDQEFLHANERKMLHFQSALCDTMIISAKQQATTRTLSGLLAKLCRAKQNIFLENY